MWRRANIGNADFLFVLDSSTKLIACKVIIIVLIRLLIFMSQIRQKSQIIDDDSEFRIEELQSLDKGGRRINQKNYQIVSIIGSQSSGKSTLLNSLFGTTFQQQNRTQRLGQTTKGIWFSVDTPNNIMILDVEGSDSNERQQRTRVQRRNSLFSFAISHTLLINIGIEQIGTYKGAQLQILEVILELNLRLFGAQRPKQIVFVVRDYVKKKQNQKYLKEKLQSKVQLAWEKIPKPEDKKNVQLKDIFNLNVFFLPNKLQPRQQQNWIIATQQLKDYLIGSTTNQELTKGNISLSDLPQYMNNVWKTIVSDKDINLPQQKILLSNMRCQQIRRNIEDNYTNRFRDQMDRSERELDLKFKAEIGKIMKEMLKQYDDETVQYIQEESDKIKNQMILQFEDKIYLSFQKQTKQVSENWQKKYADEADSQFSNNKDIKSVQKLKQQFKAKFTNDILLISYKQEWSRSYIADFEVELLKRLQGIKQKIVAESMKQYFRLSRKQMENILSECFLDRQKFTNTFWASIRGSLEKLSYKSRNSIQNLFESVKLNIDKQEKNKRINDLIQKAQEQVIQQLRGSIKLKCVDLNTFIMKHFINEFTIDGSVPRQWTALKEEQITEIYEKLKKKYIGVISKFKNLQLTEKKQKLPTMSMIVCESETDETILDIKEEVALIKKVEDEMKKQLEEALKKSKQTYSTSIPTWAYVLLGIVAVDDIILWFTSPMLAIPLLLVIVIFIGAFLKGGRGLIDQLIGMAKDKAASAVSSATISAASSFSKKSD